MKNSLKTIKLSLKPQAINSDPAHAHGAGIVPAAEDLLDLIGGAVEAGALRPDVAIMASNRCG